MNDGNAHHEAQVLRLLSMFQTLELSLKFYVAASYKQIKGALNGRLPFHYSYKDIENFSLERLLSVFAKLNDDKPLQARLKKLVSKRNLVAHRALVYRHKVIADLLEINQSDLLQDLKAVEIELDDCLKILSPSIEERLGFAEESELRPNTSLERTRER